MSIGQPINPGQCKNIAPFPISKGNTPEITEFVPVVLIGSSSSLGIGEELLLKLKYDCEFGKTSEYPTLPEEGIIVSQLIGSVVAVNGDIAQVGAQVSLSMLNGILTFIPGASTNYAQVVNVVGTTFADGDAEMVLIDNKFTLKLSTTVPINVAFNVSIMDVGLLRRFAITSYPLNI